MHDIPGMEEDQENRRIRCLLVGAAVCGMAALVITALVGTVLIATNFNLLEWLE